LKQEPHKHAQRLADFLQRLADFLGCWLSPSEIEQFVWRCSYGRLSNSAVNKDPFNIHWTGWDFSLFFRRGIVGESMEQLTPDMVEQLREVARQKWEGYCLKFQSVDEILDSSN